MDALNASTTSVTLKNYDILGNEVATLVNKNKLPEIMRLISHSLFKWQKKNIMALPTFKT